MDTTTATQPTAETFWRQFNQAIENLGDFAQQVERSLAPTAKQQYLDTLGLGAVLADLEANTETLKAKWVAKNGLSAIAQRAKEWMDDAKALVLVSGTIDGKNAEIRDAQLALALKNDPAYKDAKATFDEATHALGEIDGHLEHARAVQSALKVKARILAAQLEFLAGER